MLHHHGPLVSVFCAEAWYRRAAEDVAAMAGFDRPKVVSATGLVSGCPSQTAGLATKE